MKKRLLVFLIGGLLLLTPAGHCENSASILEEIGVTRGICVVLGNNPSDLAIDLAEQSELTVYVQIPASSDLELMRRAVDAAGLYGTRIFVEQGPLTALHLADNIADAVVVLGNAEDATVRELMRVLRPGGKLWLPGAVKVKPIPKGLAETEGDQSPHAVSRGLVKHGCQRQAHLEPCLRPKQGHRHLP